MDSIPSNSSMMTLRPALQHAQGWNGHASPMQTLPSGFDDDAITLLMRDGSRLRVALLEPVHQAVSLAAALAPASVRPDTITLDLNDGSRLMLASADILGLHLPPERPIAAAPVRPAPAAPGAMRAQDVHVYPLGTQRVMQIRNFLPADAVTSLYRYVLGKQQDFKPSQVISNDPEYRKSVVLFKFPEYETMFANTMRAVLPQITDALELQRFDMGSFECQLTATSDKGYFKPHNDNAAALAHRKITYVYYFHRQPKPFTGGEIRFFDHNPFAVDTGTARQVLDLAPLHNSVVFFPSGCFHEVRDTICATPSFENSRFTINGWLGTTKPQAPAKP